MLYTECFHYPPPKKLPLPHQCSFSVAKCCAILHPGLPTQLIAEQSVRVFVVSKFSTNPNLQNIQRTGTHIGTTTPLHLTTTNMVDCTLFNSMRDTIMAAVANARKQSCIGPVIGGRQSKAALTDEHFALQPLHWHSCMHHTQRFPHVEYKPCTMRHPQPYPSQQRAHHSSTVRGQQPSNGLQAQLLRSDRHTDHVTSRLLSLL